MKRIFAIAAGILVFLIVGTQLPPSDDIVADAQEHFSAEAIADGQRFAWQRRWLYWGRVTVQFLFLSALVFLPIGKRLERTLGRWVGYQWAAHVGLLAGAYWVGNWILAVPFRAAGFALLGSWGMTTQTPLAWIGDLFLHFAVATVLEAIAFFGLYGLMRYMPKSWWLVAGLGSMALGAVFALILPEWIAPLFNKFTPLARTKYKDLEPNLRQLGKQVGIVTDEIYVVDASRQSTHSNAYFTGIGPRQRIVLYDNLLDNHSPDEVETVVAHEMGHWWHRHILQGILYGGIALTLALYLLHLYLARHMETGIWRDPGDPAGVFLVLWIANLAIAAATPIECAVSRHFERQADEMSLKLSKKPDAFVAAEKRLALVNKSDVAPSRLNVLLFGTHPPVVERIRMGQENQVGRNSSP